MKILNHPVHAVPCTSSPSSPSPLLSPSEPLRAFLVTAAGKCCRRLYLPLLQPNERRRRLLVAPWENLCLEGPPQPHRARETNIAAIFAGVLGRRAKEKILAQMWQKKMLEKILLSHWRYVVRLYPKKEEFYDEFPSLGKLGAGGEGRFLCHGKPNIHASSSSS